MNKPQDINEQFYSCNIETYFPEYGPVAHINHATLTPKEALRLAGWLTRYAKWSKDKGRFDERKMRY